MTVTINAVTSTGLVQTSDGSGVIKVQSNGVTTNALAWVNFDGTPATPTPRSSYNVTSITKNAAGDYTIALTTATVDANYSIICQNVQTSGNNPVNTCLNTNRTNTTSVFNIICCQASVRFDGAYIAAAIFGN